jgi:hypothetical protein
LKKKHVIELSAVALASLLSAPHLNAQTFALNSSESFATSQANLGAGIGVLPPAIQTVVNNLTSYKTTEEGINAGLVGAAGMASGAVTSKEGEITTKIADINALISANSLDPQIAVEQGNLVTLQGDLSTLESNLAAANAVVQNSDIKIALYQNAIDNPVAAAQAAAASAAAAITDASAQYSAGADPTNPDYVKTGTSGLQGVIDTIDGVTAGDPAAVTNAITASDLAFPGAAAASVADIQELVGVIDAELPNLPPISTVDKDAALETVLNGSYERHAIDVIANGGIDGIVTKDDVTGAIHIGENSLITNEVGGVQELYAQDGSSAPIDINVNNGSDLLVGGDSVATEVEAAALDTANSIADQAFATAGDTAERNRALIAEGANTTAINNEVINRTALIRQEADGIHIGPNSLITDQRGDVAGVGGVQNVWGEDANNDSIDVVIGNPDSPLNPGNFRVLGNSQVDGNQNIDGVLSLGDNGFGGVTDVARSINSNASGIARNRNSIDQNTRGIAMVAALQHTTVLPGMTNALDVSAAHFEGETGMSINYARRINENWQVNFGAASTTDFDESVIKAGVGVQW